MTTLLATPGPGPRTSTPRRFGDRSAHGPRKDVFTTVPRVRGAGPRLVEAVAPNWFAAVMGTGIVATAGVALPAPVAGALRPFALGVWVLAALMLAGIGALTVAQWLTRPGRARAHLHHPVLTHFHGAAPMALLTVGNGALLIGRDLIGAGAALRVDQVLWTAGTLLGLATTIAMPVVLFSVSREERRNGWDAAFGGWLMPVVPPMVSAATGAALLEHTAPGQARLTLLVVCGACFGISLLATLAVVPLIWGRLASHGPPAPRLVPTLWIVLGPLGQSVTAAGLLAEHAFPRSAFPADGATSALRPAAELAAVLFGVPTLGFALVWMGIAGALTARAVRSSSSIPYAVTWWAFVFPVGTCVTGAATLARLTGADVLGGLSVLLYAGLVTAWIVVIVVGLQVVQRSRARNSSVRPPDEWAYSI